METQVSPHPFLALIAPFLLAACGMVGVAKPNQVSAEIEAVCRKQEAAWNRGDIDGFMSAGYMRSEKLSFYSGGNVERGYDAMLAHYKKSYQADGKEMGQLTFENLDPLPLDNEHAVMRGRWQLHFKTQADIGGLFTLVFVHTSEGWLIVHDHTSSDALKAKAAAG